ncbi:MAG: LegC family aminotransferase [Flavobacteriales bacterium]|nr:LegC family aminotransferase [Flavobacteriales bacterium]
MPDSIIKYIKELFPNQENIPLHEPRFTGSEKTYLNECIDSTFVSNIGPFVEKFEDSIKEYTGAKYAIALTNGTSALHLSLAALDIQPGDEVLTQPLTFVATANAIAYHKASPVFIDIDEDTLGMAPNNLFNFLNQVVEVRDDVPYNIETGNRIVACIPVHTFGHPCEIDDIVSICEEVNLPVIEDAAAAVGSFYKEQHTGTFGLAGIFSFNGNKIVTTGGGGAIITNDEAYYKKLSHLATTAKVPHASDTVHNDIGYNYKLSNLNAAVGCAQLEKIGGYLENKRELTSKYFEALADSNIQLIEEPVNTKSNYWLNALLFEDSESKEAFIKMAQAEGVMAKSVWTLMSELEMYKDCFSDDLSVAEDLSARIALIPSSVRI